MYSTNIKFIPSRYVALCSNLMFIYWCIVYWAFAFSRDEILEGNDGETHHYLHKFLTEIWVKSSFSAVLLPGISSVHPLWRVWQAVRRLTGLLPFGQVGSPESLPFFLKSFSLVSWMCVYVCVYRRKGSSFVAVLVPEDTTAHCGEQPSVSLNLETRLHQWVFLKALYFEELDTPTREWTGSRKTSGVHIVLRVGLFEGLNSVLSHKVGLSSVLEVHRSQLWQSFFVK